MSAQSAKVLLGETIQQRYRAFTLNEEPNISLPALSAIPWIGASWRRDVYRKEVSHTTPNHIKFIIKNGAPRAFLWQTSAEKLKNGVRWGIVKTHSITGKVISSLGQYRIVAHERAMKGLVSNSQALKLKLLDLYQDRFTALQAIESLVNKNTTYREYKKVFAHYIAKLDAIENQLSSYFSEVDCPGFNEQSIAQITLDIQADKRRAHAYLQRLHHEENLRPYNRSRGDDSVLEFIKQQMVHGLYELQGVNQDLTYSRTRYFAFTRGEMNDFIEDARKEIDEHEADPRNAVTAKHHGFYSSNKNELIAYDFAQDNLPSVRQQQVLTAISFIEGWDVLDNKKGQTPFVSNGSEKEELECYSATRWRTHRSVRAAVKSISSFLLNIFKGIFVPTRPWAEEDWYNRNFHLNAVKLHKQVAAIEPMWKKPVYFVMQLGNGFMDIFYGIRDFGAKLIIGMPEDIVNDWESSKALPALDEVLAHVTIEANAIFAAEEQLLEELLKQCGDKLKEDAPSKVRLAGVEYELSGGEFNDVLNSMVRGVNGFSSVFTHNIYAKDPVGGLIFTTTYLVGIGMIYSPAYSASIFGSAFVNAFSNMSYTMASSPLGAAVAGGSTLAEISAVFWDGLAHGTSGIAANTFYQCGEDPLTIGAYCVAAYTLGYFLVNGVAGYKIPWLSHLLQEDLGSDPSTGYPLIGAKFAVMLYELLVAHSVKHHEQPDLVAPRHEHATIMAPERERIVQRFKLVSWLIVQAKMLPKLEVADKLALARQMDALFSKEESESLKKLLYPESHPSIAFQVFSLPLSYIPAVLRFMISPALSLVAWIKGTPNPAEPVRRAGTFLVDKIKKDLSRFIVVGTNIIYLFYSVTAAFIKLPAYLITLSIGRVAGLFDAKPAHALHRLFAMVHNFMRSMGEFFYPARAMKDVHVAHPTDTILKTEASYLTLLQQMGQGEATSAPSEEATSSSGFFSPRCTEIAEQRLSSEADSDTPEIGSGRL